MKIYLVRHGETTGDIENRIGGSYDDHLTEKGRAQLVQTAQGLAGKNIDIIFSSSLLRAKESAHIIQEKLKCPLEILDGLQERHYGVLTGMDMNEARTKYPEAIARHYDVTYVHPEGENYPDFYERVTRAFQSIASQNYKSAVVVAHGGSIKCILKSLNKPLPAKIGDGEILELEKECCSSLDH